MIGSAGKELLALLVHHRIDRPHALKIPARRADSTLTENVASPFQAEPRQGNAAGKWHITTTVLFDANLCNHNERETNLQELKLDGSALEPPIEFGPIDIGECPLLSSGKGINIFHLLLQATVYGFEHKEDLPRIPLDKLRVLAVDGFMQEHLIDVKKGETLKFVS
jgi:hypothetical protein